jgi:hypothetical protein
MLVSMVSLSGALRVSTTLLRRFASFRARIINSPPRGHSSLVNDSPVSACQFLAASEAQFGSLLGL